MKRKEWVLGCRLGGYCHDTTVGRGEEKEDILHDGLVKLRSLVGKLRELDIPLGNKAGY